MILTKSTNKVEVIPVVLETHPNAEKLSIVRAEGYTIVVNTLQWTGVEKAGHVLPETIVDVTREEFSWLRKEGDTNTKYRVKACKLRGVQSYGFLVKVPDHFNIGDDAAEFLGATHYEPELEYSTYGDNVSAPKIHPECLRKYDVDSFLKYNRLFTEGEEIYVTSKINGSNARYINHNKQIYCGSRSFWKKEGETDLWWQALKNTPNLKEYLEANPETLLWGEVYGKVKGFKYGTDKPKFICFDVFREGKFLNSQEAMDECSKAQVPFVPLVYHGPYSFDLIKELAPKPCVLDPYELNEGVVLKPSVERVDSRLGRVILKCINPTYLE